MLGIIWLISAARWLIEWLVFLGALFVLFIVVSLLAACGPLPPGTANPSCVVHCIDADAGNGSVSVSSDVTKGTE